MMQFPCNEASLQESSSLCGLCFLDVVRRALKPQASCFDSRYVYVYLFAFVCVCCVCVCVCMHVQAPMRTCMCVYRMFAVCFGSEGLAVETCEAHVPVLALFALHELQSKTTTSLLLEFENDCGERGICGPQILVAVTHTHTHTHLSPPSIHHG